MRRDHPSRRIDHTTPGHGAAGGIDATDIVVAGDVHLGAHNADTAGFESFLDALYGREPAHLVLLGDVWDLLRRDPFGCAFETATTIARLQRLASRQPVHVVVGNHDGELRHLDPARYGVEFVGDLVLESGDTSIRFCHGDGFDRLQSEAVTRLLSGPGDRGDFDPTRGRKDAVVARGRDAFQRAKRGLRRFTRPGRDARASFPRRERRAHAYLDTIPEDKLVFGHTHNPYVHPDNTAANPGSWKTTAPVHGTYLVVRAGVISLHRHRPAGDDERLDHGGGWRRRGEADQPPRPPPTDG